MAIIFDLSPSTATESTAFKQRWLEGPTTPDSGWSHNGPIRHTWVTEEARAPWTKSLKLVMPRSDGVGVNRYQLVLNTPTITISDGPVVDRWYAFSIMLGDDWKLEQCGDGGNWFVNLVGFRFTNNSANGPGNNLDTYPAAGADNATGGNLTPTALPSRWQVSTNISGTTGIPTARHILGNIVKGQWLDFVLHMGWSTSSNGFREEWLNGVYAGRYDGQTVLNYTPPSGTTQNFESRIGVYQGYRIDHVRTIYFGHYRSGTTEADVVLPGAPPSGNTVPGTPQNLTASVNSSTGIVTLDWDNAVDGITDYWAVRRDSQPDPNTASWARLPTDYTASTATDDPGPGTWFYYVTAVDSAVAPVSVSNRSAVVQATVATPVNPTNMAILGPKMRRIAAATAVIPQPGPDPTPTVGFNPGPLLVDLDFDPSGTTGQWDEVLIDSNSGGSGGTIDIVTSPVAEGQYAARIQQAAHDSAHIRAELQNHRAPGAAQFMNGEERYYQFKIFPVRSGVITLGPPDYCINQFRSTNILCYTGGINLRPDNGDLIYNVLGGDQGSGCDSWPVNQSIVFGKVQYGAWSTIQMHVKWTPTSAGFTKLWYNGNLVVNYTGPTHGTAIAGSVIMFRVGIYAGWHTGTHEIVYDDCKIWGP